MSTSVKIRQTGISLQGDQFAGGFAGALMLHGGIAVLLISWALFTSSGRSWGTNIENNGSIRATMVNALPLPPKAAMNPDNVLATEAPSPAPVIATQRTVEAQRPDAVDIPAKTEKPAQTAEKTTPPPPLHPQPVKEDPNKAQTGEASGLNVAMSSTQTKAGTISVGVTDAAFGTRFAYYIEQINRSLAKEWYVGMLDAQASGRRVYITFQIARDGTPSHVKIESASGDKTLDDTALSAVEHIETFGPLPDAYQGSYVNVQYYFEAPPRQ